MEGKGWQIDHRYYTALYKLPTHTIITTLNAKGKTFIVISNPLVLQSAVKLNFDGTSILLILLFL